MAEDGMREYNFDQWSEEYERKWILENGRLVPSKGVSYRWQKMYIEHFGRFVDPREEGWRPNPVLDFKQYRRFGHVVAIMIKIGNDNPVTPDNGIQHTFRNRMPRVGEMVVSVIEIIRDNPTDPDAPFKCELRGGTPMMSGNVRETAQVSYPQQPMVEPSFTSIATTQSGQTPPQPTTTPVTNPPAEQRQPQVRLRSARPTS